MDLINVPPNTIDRANRHPAFPQGPAPIRERGVCSTAPLGGGRSPLALDSGHSHSPSPPLAKWKGCSLSPRSSSPSKRT